MTVSSFGIGPEGVVPKTPFSKVVSKVDSGFVRPAFTLKTGSMCVRAAAVRSSDLPTSSRAFLAERLFRRAWSMAFSRLMTSTPGGTTRGSCANAVDPAATSSITEMIVLLIKPGIAALPFLSDVWSRFGQRQDRKWAGVVAYAERYILRCI